MSPKTVVTYELQTYRERRWVIDSMYTERDIAIAMFEQILEARRAPAVRIVKECYTEERGPVSAVIYRRSLGDPLPVKPAEQKASSGGTVMVQGPREPEKAASKLTWLVVKLLGLIAGGGVAVGAMHHLLLSQ